MGSRRSWVQIPSPRQWKTDAGQPGQNIRSETIISLLSASEKELPKTDQKKTKIQKAEAVGKLVAEKAKKINVIKVVFDRSGYQYHGRVKALAQGARDGGLSF